MKFIEYLEGIVSTKKSIAKWLWLLLKLEAKLASSQAYPLLIKMSILIALFIVIWLAIMVSLGYVIVVTIGAHFLVGMSVILFFNICCLIYLFKSLNTCLRYMSFEKTRACLANNVSST